MFENGNSRRGCGMFFKYKSNDSQCSKQLTSDEYNTSPRCTWPWQLLILSLTALCGLLYLTALGLICQPYKNMADLSEGRELRATIIAAISLRVSWLNNFFQIVILEYNFYIEFKLKSNEAIK